MKHLSRVLIALIVIVMGVALFAPAVIPLIADPPRASVVARPQVIMEVLDPELEQFAPAWRDEIARRYSNAVGIFMHGGDLVKGEWVAGVAYSSGRHYVPVREQVERVQKLYPGRTVVLLACNPGHLKLGIPGVVYAPGNTWIIPDRAVDPLDMMAGTAANGGKSRWAISPDTAGNIFEFVQD